MLPTENGSEKSKLSKAESARINGSKSRGATTPEGKMRAANGNFKHGAYSTRVVMEDENLEAYQALYNHYVETYLPQGFFENECVTTMANMRWRLRRLESAETANLNAAVALNKPYIEARFEKLDVTTERALAIEATATHIERMTRVEERLQRLYERSLKLLTNHRRKSGRAMPSVEEPELPAEPEITPEPEILTDPPNSQPSQPQPSPSPVDIISKVAMVLVIFAMLFLVPLKMTAKAQIRTAPIHTERCILSPYKLSGVQK